MSKNPPKINSGRGGASVTSSSRLHFLSPQAIQLLTLHKDNPGIDVAQRVLNRCRSLKEPSHAHAQSESDRYFCRCRFHDGCGFLWYSPILFAKPWVREMGYDINDKAKMEEMKKSAGPPTLAHSSPVLVSAFVLGALLPRNGMCNPSTSGCSWHSRWLGFVATVQLKDESGNETAMNEPK